MTDADLPQCEEVLRVLFDYLDDELEDGSRQRVESHLERCRSCFSRAEFEQRLKGHAAELASEPVPPALEDRIRSLIAGFKAAAPDDEDRPAVPGA